MICRFLGLGPAFRRRTVTVAELRPGEAVLNAGCGTGVLTQLAAQAVQPIGVAWGIDPAPDMIRIALMKVGLEGSPARFKPGAIEKLSFGDDTFDVALISLVLHHLPTSGRGLGVE